MATETLKKTMTGDEMIALSKKHTPFEWSAQSTVDPHPVERAKGMSSCTHAGNGVSADTSELRSVQCRRGAATAAGTSLLADRSRAV